MSKYQAIIFDLDGTAIPNSRDGLPSARLIKAIKKHRDHTHLIAASGRPLLLATPVLQALGLTDPCIISGGTILIDPGTLQILQQTNLPVAAVHAVLNLLKNHPYRVTLRDEFIDPHHPSAQQALIENVEIIFISQVPLTEVPALKQALESIPDLTATVVPDWSGQHYALNITHLNATKEHAVTDLLRRLRIDRTHTIGVGDGDNDLHLFAAVGHKVAMGNAGPRLKAAADEIAPSVDQDGLAEIIERYA